MAAATDFIPVYSPESARAFAPDPAGRDARPLATVVPLFAPQDAPALHLTRRGRRAVAALVLALGAAMVWLAAHSAPAAVAPRSGPAPASVTVAPGDTLWSIAARVAPGTDPRAEVDTLQRLNHLAGPALVPGQVLRTR